MTIRESWLPEFLEVSHSTDVQSIVSGFIRFTNVDEIEQKSEECKSVKIEPNLIVQRMQNALIKQLLQPVRNFFRAWSYPQTNSTVLAMGNAR